VRRHVHEPRGAGIVDPVSGQFVAERGVVAIAEQAKPSAGCGLSNNGGVLERDVPEILGLWDLCSGRRDAKRRDLP
jgi:hypothetical protein